MNRPLNFVAVFLAWSFLAVGLRAHDSSRPQVTQLAVTADGSTAYVLQIQSGKIMRWSSKVAEQGVEAFETFSPTAASNIVDMIVSDTTHELLMACDGPPRLIRQPLAGGQPTTVTLSAPPGRIALTKESDGKVAICISMPSTQSVWIDSLSKSQEMNGRRLRLKFPPKEVIGLGENLFVIADAVGNRVSVVDAPSREQVKSFTLNGYHLAGLAIDAGSSSLLVTHQVLSSNARTDKDDIRWGSLIQNNVASIPLVSLAEMKLRLTTDTIYRLGEFGRGAADPAGVVAVGERIAVALSGTDEVALYSKPQRQAKFVTVGHVPERLFRFGEDRLLCVHRFDQRIAVINCQGDTPRLERMIGDEQPITTARQRGELAYYSGQLSHEGWMSCNSCHIDGSSPDLLVDTLGDGTFDSPKKIPSLENVTETGPWAWHGGQHTLRDQIAKTLTSTMHTPDEFPESTGLVRDTLVDDLIEYLSSLNSRPTLSEGSSDITTEQVSMQTSAYVGGEALFQQHCARCHDPDQQFTTPRTYDVGVNDERGQKQFNPPSLIGVRLRTKFMHDGRFDSLKQVITSHPKPAIDLTPVEQGQLHQYLQSL